MAIKKERKKIFDFSLLKKVFHFAAPYKKKFYLSVFLSVVLAIIAPLRPYFIQVPINTFIKDHNARWLILIIFFLKPFCFLF